MSNAQLIMAVVLLLGVAGEATAAPEDFARGRPIEATGESKLQRVRLPQDVYEWVTSPNLGDLRAFDAAGREVPYQILRPKRREEFAAWVDVSVFELPTAAAGTAEGSRLDIKLDEHGAVVSVAGGHQAGASGASFLIDASTLERPISQLRFDWQSEGFIGQVRLEASADLNEWRTIAESATLAELRAEGAEIRKDIVEFAPNSSPYLRLTQLSAPPGPQAKLQLSAVQARSRDAQLPPRAWKTLEPTIHDDGFEYHTGGLFPLDRVTVVVDAPTYILEGAVYSRSDADGRWQSRGTHTFYATRVGEQSLAAVPLAAVPHQYWRVELDASKIPLVPLLRVGWRPDEVAFFPQGSEPMLLAYGRATTAGRQWPVAELLAQMGETESLESAELVELGAPITLGGEAVRAAATQVDWRTALLWFALIVGVVLVAGLAYRLLKAPDPE